MKIHQLGNGGYVFEPETEEEQTALDLFAQDFGVSPDLGTGDGGPDHN